jgi:hypothetical protein
MIKIRSSTPREHGKTIVLRRDGDVQMLLLGRRVLALS